MGRAAAVSEKLPGEGGACRAVGLRLFWRSVRSNWVLFKENRIGLVGLGIILWYVLMVVIHPVLVRAV